MPLFSFPPFWHRMAAALYDSFILFSLLLLATALALLFHPHPAAEPMRPFFLTYLLGIIGLFLSGCWSYRGHTLGMLAWKMRVVTCTGASLSFRQALFRYGIALLSLLPAGLSWWWCLFDKEKQALHDRLSGNRVILQMPSSQKNNPGQPQ